MIKARKAAALLLPVLLMAALGCSAGGNLNAPEKRLVIDVIVKKVDADFWKVVQMGAEAAGKEFDVTVNFQGPTNENDINGEIGYVDQAIKDKADAIVLAASDYTRLVGVVEKAVSEKIPVLVIDSDVKSDKTKCFIGTDNVDAGRKLGQSLVDKVGQSCKIAVMGFIKGAATNDQREQGLTDVMGQHPGIGLISMLYCNSDTGYAEQLTADIIGKHPDINAIVCLNAYGTAGAARAVSKLNLDGKVKIIGFDSTPDEISFMEKGTIQSLVIQNPYSMGYLGVKCALDTIHGKAVPKNLNTGATVVDRDNMYLPENQKLLFPFTS